MGTQRDKHILPRHSAGKGTGRYIGLFVLILALLSFGWWISRNRPQNETVDAMEAEPTQTTIPDDETYRMLVGASKEVQPQMYAFYSACIPQILAAQDKNCVFSPVNLYVTLGLLAEFCDDESQQALMELLNADTLAEVRTRCQTIQQANCYSCSSYISSVNSSVWLPRSMSGSKELLQSISSRYHTSIYRYDSKNARKDSMNRWIRDHTGGQFQLNVNNNAILTILSSLYLKSTWVYPFRLEDTAEAEFHGLHGSSRCSMMYHTYPDVCFEAETFTSIRLPMSNGCVHFLLPNEGFNLDDVAADPDLFQIFNNLNDTTLAFRYAHIHVGLPRFSMESNLELSEDFEAIKGVLATVSVPAERLIPYGKCPIQVKHYSAVSFDEMGVDGAGLTTLGYLFGERTTEKVEFIMNQPFLYFIQANDFSILYAGVVYDI